MSDYENVFAIRVRALLEEAESWDMSTATLDQDHVACALREVGKFARTHVYYKKELQSAIDEVRS